MNTLSIHQWAMIAASVVLMIVVMGLFWRLINWALFREAFFPRKPKPVSPSDLHEYEGDKR